MLTYWAGKRQETGRIREITNPFDQSVIDTVPDFDPVSLDEAMHVSQRGVTELAKLSSEEVGRILKRAAASMHARKAEWAETITREEGKPLVESNLEVEAAIQLMDLSGREAFWLGSELTPLAVEAAVNGRFGFTLRRAFGVVAAVTPHVYPLLLPCTVAVPALIAGNSVVLKPAHATPLSVLRLVDLLLESGLPDSSIACLTGDGPTLVPGLCGHPHVDRIVLIGSRSAAAAVRRHAGLKPTELQWGCPGAVMVAVDADLDQVADLIVGKAFENAGQIGFASPWVLAAPAVYPALVEQLQQRISTLPCGDPLDAETRVGPLIDEARAGQVMALIARAEEQGARCLCGGERDRGLVRPTLLGDVAPGQGAFGCNEVLGPVIGVSRIASLEDAPRFLNSADQLVVSIFSQDLERTMRLARQLQVTNVHVNGIPSWRDGLLDQSRSSYRVGRHTVRDRALNMTTFQDVVHHA